MKFTFAILPLLATATGVLAAPAAKPLQVSISLVKDNVKSSDLTVSATISNPTKEDLRVLRYNNVLDGENPSKSFALFKNGTEIGFNGVRLSPDISSNDVFRVIPAGSSVTVEHDLGTRFNFEEGGPGTYTVKAIGLFQYGDAAENIVPIEANAVDVEISDVDGVVNIDQTTPVCSDQGRLNQLTAALAEGRALAGGAATDTRSHPNSASINAYFNDNSRDTIWWNLDRIAGDLPSSGVRILSCTDTHNVCAPNPNIVAYTWLVYSGNTILSSDIFGCDPFWNSPPTSNICAGGGRLVRGGVLVHELSHAVFLADDVVYGCDASRALSTADKLRNADNYDCFTIDIYRTYRC